MRISDWSSDVCSSDLHDVHIDRNVLAGFHLTANIETRRIAQTHAITHQALCQQALVNAFETRQLQAIIDADNFPALRRLYAVDGEPLIDGDRTARKRVV